MMIGGVILKAMKSPCVEIVGKVKLRRAQAEGPTSEKQLVRVRDNEAEEAVAARKEMSLLRCE